MIINFIKPSNIFSASRLSNIKRAEYKKSAMPQLKGQPASDTVSFSGAAQLIGANMQYAPSSKICREVHENAKSPAYNLGLILQKYVSPVNNTQKNGSEPPVKLKIRVKSPSSIREKTISKFSEIERDNKRAFADAAVSEIFKYYIPEKGYTKEMAAADTKNFMEISDKNIYFTVYNNKKVYNLLTSVLYKKKMLNENKDSKIFNQCSFN